MGCSRQRYRTVEQYTFNARHWRQVLGNPLPFDTGHLRTLPSCVSLHLPYRGSSSLCPCLTARLVCKTANHDTIPPLYRSRIHGSLDSISVHSLGDLFYLRCLLLLPNFPGPGLTTSRRRRCLHLCCCPPVPSPPLPNRSFFCSVPIPSRAGAHGGVSSSGQVTSVLFLGWVIRLKRAAGRSLGGAEPTD